MTQFDTNEFNTTEMSVIVQGMAVEVKLQSKTMLLYNYSRLVVAVHIGESCIGYIQRNGEIFHAYAPQQSPSPAYTYIEQAVYRLVYEWLIT